MTSGVCLSISMTLVTVYDGISISTSSLAESAGIILTTDDMSDIESIEPDEAFQCSGIIRWNYADVLTSDPVSAIIAANTHNTDLMVTVRQTTALAVPMATALQKFAPAVLKATALQTYAPAVLMATALQTFAPAVLMATAHQTFAPAVLKATALQTYAPVALMATALQTYAPAVLMVTTLRMFAPAVLMATVLQTFAPAVPMVTTLQRYVLTDRATAGLRQTVIALTVRNRVNCVLAVSKAVTLQT